MYNNNRKGESNGDNGHQGDKNDGDPDELDVDIAGPLTSSQSSQSYSLQVARTWEQSKKPSHPHLLPPSMRHPIGKEVTYFQEEVSAGNSAHTQADAFANGYGVENLIKHTEFAMPQHVQSNETILGTFRSSIPQDVFEKIKDRINASREREKLSVAKQILRKEEERKKLARDRDALDLQSKINTLTETLELEKARRQKFSALLKQKKTAEDAMKKQQVLRERGREVGNHISAQHSYPNAQMLISQTNPSAQRPRLMNYPTMGIPMNNLLAHQSSSHLDLQNSVSSKRQRSTSPNPGANQHQSRNSGDANFNRNAPTGQPNSKPYRSHLAPPNDSHLSSHSPRSSGVKSPNKTQGSTVSMTVGHQMSSQNPAMGMPYAVASPYPMAGMGNQVLMVVPNLVGGQGVPGQLLNPALLQKPEHLQALTPQQQQALMAQHIQTLNPSNQEYLRAVIESQMARGASDAQAQALYRQYAASGMIPHQMMVRAQMPINNAPSPHSVMSQQSADGSQRVGSIMTGIPVFGPTNPYSNAGLPPTSHGNPNHHYSRSGANS